MFLLSRRSAPVIVSVCGLKFVIMMPRGRFMVSLLRKNDVSAVESIESTDTPNGETSNQMDAFNKKRNRHQFELLNGAELIDFKRKLRRRNHPIRYARSKDDNDNDFSADDLSDEYLPPQPQGPRKQYTGSDSDCTEILSNCPEAKEYNVEINSLITPSDLGLELASNSRPVHQNSYSVLDTNSAAAQGVDDINNMELAIRTITKSPAMTESFHKDPALPEILTYEILSCSLEREPKILSDLCLISSCHQNVSPTNNFRILDAPVMTETLDQEPALPGILTNDAPSCGPERRELKIPSDPCSIGFSHQNVSPTNSFYISNLEAAVITKTLRQEPVLPGILTNDDSSCGPEMHAPEIPSDSYLVGSSRQNISLPGTASSHENEISKKRVYPRKTSSGRKRQRNPQSWKMNKLKTLRNSGLEYTNKKGKLVKERALGPGCKIDKDCKRKCHTNISHGHRKHLFTQFWAMGNHDKQVEYLARFITRVQRKTVQLNNIHSRRHCTYQYYLPALGEKVRVCKKMFLDSFNITDMWITTMFKKMDENNEDVIPNDRRGKHCNRRNAINENIKISVRQHINSIPVKESHYVRQRTSKLYFEESLTFPKLYSLYIEWMTENKPSDAKATQEQYRQIFYKEFNIDFFKPKKDQCLKCEVHEKASELEKEITAPVYALHIANKCIIRQIKDNDKIEAKQSKKTLLTACFDLQKILTTPQSDVSTFYYKRKFHVFNFTIFDIGSAEGHCYVWDECIGKKGPNEIASFLFDFIKKKTADGITEFRFYSDCCGGQNRNRILFLMYAYAAKTFRVVITHNFFEVGHSQSEGDSMHALIERRKKNQVIYVPQQWYTLIRCAKITGKPYVVNEVTQNDIFDFKSLLNLVPNWELDKDKNKMMWSKVNHIKINYETPNIIMFQNDFYSDQLSWIDLDFHKVKTRRMNRNKSLIALWDQNLVRAYENLHPINQSKYKDLCSLCSNGAIPEQYRHFYTNLPHSNIVTNNSDTED